MPRYAAIDIGSNSVRMMAADVRDDATEILLQERQVTRLGEGVFRDGLISENALEFLGQVLRRMAAAVGRLNVAGLRVVATSAVRDAGNQADFLRRSAEAVGTEVEIISGAEESRLVHLGVQARWPRAGERTLLVDVGGGSAELIVSAGTQMIDSVSVPCGAVRLTELFLEHDPARPDEISRMQSFVAEKMHDFYQRHSRTKFDRAIGTSASAAAIVSAVNRIPRATREDANRFPAPIGDLRHLFRALATSDVAQRRKVTGIGPRRAEIIVAGAAVFLHVLEMFNHAVFYYSSAGVQDGLIADLAARGVGRELSRLSEEQRSVMEAMAERYRVKRGHAAKVALLSMQLFELLQPVTELHAGDGKILEAAAWLHDIGHFVSNNGHHKHSAYLVANSDLPGFNDAEREAIGALCRFHRKSLPQPKHPAFDLLHPEAKRLVVALTPLLRLADSLDRSHEGRVQGLRASMRDGNVMLTVQAERDVDFEMWAAADALRMFRDLYGRSITLQRAQRQSA